MIKVMKKILACSLATALTLGVAGTAFAAKSPTDAPKAEVNKNVQTTVGKVSTKADGTATVSQIKKTNKKSVAVASTVAVDGVTYKVTTLGANAFANCKKVTKVTLPTTIRVISKNAFKGAKKLKTITLKVKKSITIKKGAFQGLKTKKMVIKVSKKMSKKELKKFQKALKKAGFKGKVKKA